MRQMMLRLAGILVPVLNCAVLAAPPQAVNDLQIHLLDSLHLELSWSPVDSDVEGHPLSCVEYDVHAGTMPWFAPAPATLIASTPATTSEVPVADLMGFFRVVARTCPPALPADLVVVPSGVFQMGQVGVAEPVHEVTLSRDYALGACEVTNAQFIQAAQWALDHGQLSYSNQRLYCHGQLVMELVGSLVEVTWNSGTLGLRRAPLAWLWGYADAYTYDPSVHPVKLITWYGAACYCDWRSQMEGLAPYYEGAWAEIPGARNPYGAEGYRLPTEAEWEHAARWQDDRSYPWGETAPNCVLANHLGGSYCVGWSSPVGTHLAGGSSLGLQDMAGNAWEWCNDWYAAYGPSEQVDPVGQAGGDYRVGRGGGWGLGWTYLRAANRHFGTPTDVATNIGFRVCRTVPR